MKSHFLYTKQQRNGILLLLGCIILLQFVYQSVDFRKDTDLVFEDDEVIAFRTQIDSLRKVAIENAKPKIYPFNPNFISDYKGYQLGMSLAEIDRLHQFREKGKYVNSKHEFQRVTKVSDSLLDRISVHFKFPSWIQKKRNQKSIKKMTFNHGVQKDQTLVSTTDLNLATFTDFLAVEGVDEGVAERIIKYRAKLKGFVFSDQVYEVWGIKKAIGDQILQTFSVQSLPTIEKININTASFKEVLKNPYIDYELCVKIFDYRDEVAELQDISELKNIEGFPIAKYDRIVVYLLAQ